MEDIMEIEYLKANIRKLAKEIQATSQQTQEASDLINFEISDGVEKVPKVTEPSSSVDNSNGEHLELTAEDDVKVIVSPVANTINLSDINKNLELLIYNTKFYKELNLIPRVDKYHSVVFKRFLVTCERAERNLNIVTAKENQHFVEALMSKLNDDLFLILDAASPKTFQQFRTIFIKHYHEYSLSKLQTINVNTDLPILDSLKELKLLKVEYQAYHEFELDGESPKLSDQEIDELLLNHILEHKSSYYSAQILNCTTVEDLQKLIT